MLGTILSSDSKVWEPRQSLEVWVKKFRTNKMRTKTTQPIVPLEVWQRNLRLRNVLNILGCQKGQKGQLRWLSLQSQVTALETDKFGFFSSSSAAYVLWAPKAQHGLKWTYPVSKLMALPLFDNVRTATISTNTQQIKAFTPPQNPTPNTPLFTAMIVDITFPLDNDQVTPFSTLTHSSARFLYLDCSLK